MRQPYELENLANMFLQYAKTDMSGQTAAGMLTGEEITDAIRIIAIAVAKQVYENEHKPTYWVMP